MVVVLPCKDGGLNLLPCHEPPSKEESEALETERRLEAMVKALIKRCDADRSGRLETPDELACLGEICEDDDDPKVVTEKELRCRMAIRSKHDELTTSAP